MAVYPIQNIQYATASSLSLTSSGQININAGGFLGWGFDINLTSTAASGTLYIYNQYTNPAGDTFSSTPTASLTVTSGTFSGGITRYTVDSNNVTTKPWTVLKWSGTDTSHGNIAIVGIANIF